MDSHSDSPHWLSTLDIPLSEALSQFPASVEVATIRQNQEIYCLSRQVLEEMMTMNLGALPVQCVAVPYDMRKILDREGATCLIRNVSHHLTAFFPSQFVAALYELQSFFQSEGVQAYVIGGITRDMLLSQRRRLEIQDVDITIEGDAIQVAEAIVRDSKNLELLNVFPPFGTAKLRYKGGIEMDFASTRQEVYRGCGALPEIVASGVPLQTDILRRDFTVNTLALSVSEAGQVLDCVSGLQDIETQTIRLLKVASFFEDPSRALRTLVYASRLHFSISPETQYLLAQFLVQIPTAYKGGGERIHNELYKLFSLPETPAKRRGIQFFMEKGVYQVLDSTLNSPPEPPISLETLSGKIVQLQNHFSAWWSPQLTYEIYLSWFFLGLPADQADHVMHRLGLNRTEMEIVEKGFQILCENVVCPLQGTEKAVRIYEVFHPLPLATACLGILLSPNITGPLEALAHYQSQLACVKLEVSGEDVIQLGLPQGAPVGQALKALLHAKLQGEVHNRLDEIQWLKSHIAAVAADQR